MKEFQCYKESCPMNRISKLVSDDRICDAGLEIWIKCLRYQPYVPPKPKKEEKKKVNLHEAVTEVRRKMGIILPTESDTRWLCTKIINDNREVFDALAKT